MGAKFGRLIYSLVAFVAGYALGFVYLWQMTFVMLALMPLVAISAGIIAKVFFISEFALNLPFSEYYFV